MTVNRLWYGPPPAFHWLINSALLPLSWVYCALMHGRALAYRRGWRRIHSIGVPVIVIGNVTVGGTGKTPLTIWLAQQLRAQGWRPGIVTRGYGGWEPRSAAVFVPPDATDAQRYGDEPLLLAARSGCPVVAGRDRVAAANQLVRMHNCNLVMSDDGLQHERLARDFTIVMIDGQRGFGNNRCLPAGPLRESIRRLQRVDCIVCSHVTTPPLHPAAANDNVIIGTMQLQPTMAINLRQPERHCPLTAFAGTPVTAVAAIGQPERFFHLLEQHGLTIHRRAYPDHHPLPPSVGAQWPTATVLMTEKDAVKWRAFAQPEHWYVPVTAQLNTGLIEAITCQLTPARSAAN